MANELSSKEVVSAMSYLFRCRVSLHQGDDGFFFEHFGKILDVSGRHRSVAEAAIPAARELGWTPDAGRGGR